jgi:hypothetical protein
LLLAQTSPSVYIANLTKMTVGMSPDDAECPLEWIMDAAMPYPNPPVGLCSDTHPGAHCVPSACVGTADSGGTCAALQTETACTGDGCTWHPSCPKTLAPCDSDTCTAEDCITLTVPGTCTETAAESVQADADACAAVTGTDLETDVACNAVTTATGAPCTYAGEDWRCYLHFTADETLRGAGVVSGATVSPMPLKRCPLVSLPVVGEQYVFGITGTCAWRKGDFVALSEVPEAFLPMLHGEETCPVVNTDGGGSVMLVIMLIVVFPIGSIILFALAVKFGPKGLFGKSDEKEGDEGDEHGGDVNPAAKGPAAP